MLRKLLVSAMLIAGSATAHADLIVLSEGFDNVPGLSGSGWILTNNSTPIGDSGWFQGNTGIFGSEAGAADSYVGANFANAAFGGNVDNWLITPLLNVYGSTHLNFSTRTAGGFPGDNLEVLYNASGSTSLADFVSLGTLTSANYPLDWTAFSLNTFSAGDITARFAFRYLVTDTSANGDYIGIDTVSVTSVPEPGTLAMVALALLLMPLAMRRRRVQI